MTIAIIGAGIAGLTAAFELGKNVVVFEKSRGLTGRAATRWYDRPAGRVYVDHGAQHLKLDGSTLQQLIQERLPREMLDVITAPVYTFTADNIISVGDPAYTSEARLSYRQGLNTLGRLLVQEANLQVRTEVRIDQIHRESLGGFTLYDVDGVNHGTYEQVLCAIPAGQAADLMAHSVTLPTAERYALEAELRKVKFRRCLSVTLGFDRLLPTQPYCALLNIDRNHAISWVGLEHSKLGHVPPGCAVYVVQMSGTYSLDHWDDLKEAIIHDVAERASVLLGMDLTQADWSDLQKWRYSQPDTLANPRELNRVIDGLWFAGDYLRGGRLHFAAETGAEVGQLIRAQRQQEEVASD